MSEATSLNAYARDAIGRANRKLAAAGRVPAVLYGAGFAQGMPVAIDRHDFALFLAHHSVGSSLIALAVEGEKKPVNVVVREVQYSPVKGTVLHIDFQAVRMDQAIHATVPIRLVNDPEGVRAGGVLVVDMHDVSIEALPKDLPVAIEADIGGLQIGDSLKVSDLPATEGVALLGDVDAIVCSVQAPRAEIEEEVPVEEEAAEPELVGKEETAEE
jgi:large subunit ribosomal protein L25